MSDAVKRTLVSRLPNHLVIHLKRFDFDLELLRKVKITDHCSFPSTLNMYSYTKHAHQPQPRDAPDAADFEYELVGVLVHYGTTADSGHYYSFIRDRESHGEQAGSERGQGLWYQFNDTYVEPFDPATIDVNCFGGHECFYQWDPVQMKQVWCWG